MEIYNKYPTLLTNLSKFNGMKQLNKLSLSIRGIPESFPGESSLKNAIVPLITWKVFMATSLHRYQRNW
jgi:hypothetical protein